MKKLFVMFFALLSLVALAACNGDGDKKEGAENKVVTIKLATQHPLEHMGHKAALRIKERIEKGTEGRVLVKIFPANQLGDASQIYNEVIGGSIDAAHITIPDALDSRLGVGFLPYIADDYESIKKIYKTGAFIPTEMAKMHEKLGVKFFSYFGEGFIGVGTVKELENYNKPGMEKGVMCRVPGMNVFKYGAEELGFRTTSLPYTDVYSALQTGVVKAWSGGPPNLNYTGFRDVLKYYYQYNVNFESTQYVMNMKTFMAIPEADRKVVEAAFTDEGQASFGRAEEEDQKYRKMLEDEGVKVIMLTPEELEECASYVREKAWPRLEETLTKELLDGLKATY